MLFPWDKQSSYLVIQHQRSALKTYIQKASYRHHRWAENFKYTAQVVNGQLKILVKQVWVLLSGANQFGESIFISD